MGGISRQIGSARIDGKNVDALIERMKVLSTECKRLEQVTKANVHRELHRARSSAHGDAQRIGDNGAAESRQYPRPHMRAANVRIRDGRVLADEWDAYVLTHPRSSPYHLHCWRTILESSFSHPAHYLSAHDADGRLVGVLPLIRQRSLLFGHFMTSLPFLNYGGPLGDSADVERAMMDSAGQIAAALGCRHVEFRDELGRPDWPVRANKVSMRLSLPQEPEQLWAGFSSKLRSQIRRAEREAPRVAIGGAELLPDFYSVFARNMRDLGTPVYTRRFFENILKYSSTPVHVAVGYLRDSPVSAGLMIEHGTRMEVPWASTVQAALPVGINMYFYWRVISFAIEQALQEFDFGRSTVNSGTFRFKAQWGAMPTPLHWHYWVPAKGALPALNPDNPKFRALIACWKTLPILVANTVGPTVARSLP